MELTANPPVFHSAVRRLVEDAAETTPVIATGLSHLDALLPRGGLPLGALTELLSSDFGAETLACWLAKQQLDRRAAADSAAGGRPGFVVWIDAAGDLFPPGSLALGLPAERLFLVRPANTKDALWAFDQAIRCREVAAAIAAIPDLAMPHLRRLQLGAREGGGLALLLRSARDAKNPSAASVRLEVAPAANINNNFDAAGERNNFSSADNSTRLFSFSVQVLRARGGWRSGAARVDVRLRDDPAAGGPPYYCVSSPP
jgi:hypothetical protein